MDKPRVAFDSCSILHFLLQTPKWFPHLRAIHDDAFAGNIEIVVSEVSVAECFRLDVQGTQPLASADATKIINTFFHHAYVVRRGVTSRESEFAATLIRTHGLGTCDALIVACAAYAGAEVLFTTDGCGNRRRAGKLLSVPGVSLHAEHLMKIQAPDSSPPPPCQEDAGQGA